jgi:hypothetical protein
MNLLFPPSPILDLLILLGLVFLLRLVSVDLLMVLELIWSALPKVRESVAIPAVSDRLRSGGRGGGTLVKVRIILTVVVIFGVMVGLVLVNLLVRGLAVPSPVLLLLVLVIFVVMLGFVLVNLLVILEVLSVIVLAMVLPIAIIVALVRVAGYDSITTNHHRRNDRTFGSITRIIVILSVVVSVRRRRGPLGIVTIRRPSIGTFTFISCVSLPLLVVIIIIVIVVVVVSPIGRLSLLALPTFTFTSIASLPLPVLITIITVVTVVFATLVAFVLLNALVFHPFITLLAIEVAGVVISTIRNGVRRVGLAFGGYGVGTFL